MLYFISNVHKEKLYYYLVKPEKPDTLVEIMEMVQKFALIGDKDDDEDHAREEEPGKKKD